MSRGCLLKELQWFLLLGEDKQQIKGYNLSRELGKLKYDGLHWGLLTSYSPLGKCCFCCKNSFNLPVEDRKVREIEEYPQLESNWQKRIMKGQKWCLSIAVPLGKMVDKPPLQALSTPWKKSKWKTPRPTKCAPEIIFYILILEVKWWSIHKLLIPKLLNFLAHKNQIFWDLLELNNQNGVVILVFIWLLDHREDSTHFSTTLLGRLPTGVMWLNSLKDGWGPSAPENTDLQG